MDRKEFILKAGQGAAFLFLGSCLQSCSSNSSDIPTAPQNVNFTIDLSKPEFAALQGPGGYVYQNGIIIARINESSFSALSQTCTHQGATVQFDAAAGHFHCPRHGSNFDDSGNVINGPAGSPLQKYNTSLDGNMLRIFS
ncbi:MAG: Rieske (2Fe-2S) protein [Ignavibacteria bacterium]|jgi:cytochrome b6-f complex iron-sulfur subunit|nr:Rieske (2Fe-2S) protein [Ignavibacteria bacterium]MCU7501978.1 Rieske (2Fe-2S) protein [Ignavibacteria bacterium]MCU7516946.1 Rieske (2Fe-2S) protein [Ignavibacteria bacterium]